MSIQRMMMGFARSLTGVLLILAGQWAAAASASGPPVLIGLDAEFSWPGSTSAQAIQRGIELAIDEINGKGGVLGGRPLQLLTTDNRTVPARSIQNMKDLAGKKDLVAVFCGRFWPTVIEGIETVHQLELILLDPWAAADIITDHGRQPSYTFRLSLRDSWAIPALIGYGRKNGWHSFGFMGLNTTWGRSNLKVAESIAARSRDVRLVGVEWFNWQDETLTPEYLALRQRGADAILLVANDREASILLREMSKLPKKDQLPVLSHWGVSGGQMASMAGSVLQELDFAMVQTYSFVGDARPRTRSVLTAAEKKFGIKSERALESPVGFAHAYDLTHILARAIDMAGTTRRPAVRAALEEVRDYEGLIKHYKRPFTPERHDALSESDVILTRYESDGAIVPLTDRAKAP